MPNEYGASCDYAFRVYCPLSIAMNLGMFIDDFFIDDIKTHNLKIIKVAKQRSGLYAKKYLLRRQITNKFDIVQY